MGSPKKALNRPKKRTLVRWDGKSSVDALFFMHVCSRRVIVLLISQCTPMLRVSLWCDGVYIQPTSCDSHP